MPPVDEPLDEVEHPLLNKAREQFADSATPHERIAAIDDQVLFKVKVKVGGARSGRMLPVSGLMPG